MDTLGKYLSAGLAASGCKNTLKKLSLRSFGCDPDIMAAILSQLKNLTFLDLTNCQEAVTDTVLQVIVANMPLLETLLLSNCRRLTDAGFCGLAEAMANTADHPGKIFLGSKAERVIVSDAEKKAKVKRATESGLIVGAKLEGLRRLLHLDVSSTGISDLSLAETFNFDDLRKLNISYCHGIGNAGLAAMGGPQRVLHLEELTAKQLDNVGDDGLVALLVRSPRMRVLDLEGCRGITANSVLVSAEFCTLLRNMDVSFCTGVSCSQLEASRTSMARLRTLTYRGLHIHEALEDYEEEEEEKKAKKKKKRFWQRSQNEKSPPQPPPAPPKS